MHYTGRRSFSGLTQTQPSGLESTRNATVHSDATEEAEQHRTSSRLLANYKGFAVEIEPKSATLEPFGSVTVLVRCCGDTWGKYTDIIMCRTPAFAPRSIKVMAEVQGAPLEIKVAGTVAAPGVVRMPPVCTVARGPWGDSPPLSAQVPVTGSTRRIRFINHSPFDVKLLWECNYVDPASEKLVDLVSSFRERGKAISTRFRVHEASPCTVPFSCPDAGKYTTVLGRTRRENHGHVDVTFLSSEVGQFTGFVRGIPDHVGIGSTAEDLLSAEAIAAGAGVDRVRTEYESSALRVLLTGTAVGPVLLPTSNAECHFDVTAENICCSMAAVESTKSIILTNPSECRCGLILRICVIFAPPPYDSSVACSVSVLAVQQSIQVLDSVRLVFVCCDPSMLNSVSSSRWRFCSVRRTHTRHLHRFSGGFGPQDGMYLHVLATICHRSRRVLNRRGGGSQRNECCID